MTRAAGSFDYRTVGSDAYERLLATKGALRSSGLSEQLLELVFLRVSQINGCNFCIAMHRAAAHRSGATAEHLDGLAEWRDSPVFDATERAVLAWAETVTLLGDRQGVGGQRAQLLALMTQRQLVDLTIAVSLMNALNRVAISLGQ
ncbi:carboxymuconolactone decarboxylase family protein [Roseovarius sp. C7]|uniref:carboxymuconolactone decarboxylase family protein n=1 Tax=Roseovarius sp. C7 TaxID=3398643 RepID=UPI0039F6F77D